MWFSVDRPEKLLKPTDIPKHVIDEKKSDRKTEKETSKAAAESTEVKVESQKPVEVVTSKNDHPQVPVQAKSPSTTRKKGGKKQQVMVQKKSKFMIEPEVAKTLTAKERERKLKEIVVEAFVTAAWRYERAESNKWLRWKYAGMESKKNDWLDKNGVEDMGWAVGRRIYEKEEIEVTKFNVITKNHFMMGRWYRPNTHFTNLQCEFLSENSSSILKVTNIS